MKSADDLSLRDLLRLFEEGAGAKDARAEALDALAGRRLWVATWEPEAEGFRTLLNGSGEEALPCFTSQSELVAAAERFGWLEQDGSIASHELMGAEVLRHAWTRDYAYVVVDVAATHSLELNHEELEPIARREADRTGRFRTSRPPPPKTGALGRPQRYISVPPDNNSDSSTEYRMVPPTTDVFRPSTASPPSAIDERITPELGTIESDSEAPLSDAPTERHVKLEPTAPRRKSKPAREVQEVRVADAKLGVGGTYGVASDIPQTARKQKPPSIRPSSEETTEFDPTNPAGKALPGLDFPKGEAVESLSDPSSIPPAPEAEGGPELVDELMPPPEDRTTPVRTVRPPSPMSASVHETANLLAPEDMPDEAVLKAAVEVLRAYPEVEWGCYCLVERDKGVPVPAIGLRVTENYRANVLDIVEALGESTRAAGQQLEVLLIDGHDLLRKSREAGHVFFPWKPKPPKSSGG